jgi:hypothetical protein
MAFVIPEAGESFRVLSKRDTPDVTNGSVYTMQSTRRGPAFLDDAGDLNYALSQFDYWNSSANSDLLKVPGQIEIVNS